MEADLGLAIQPRESGRKSSSRLGRNKHPQLNRMTSNSVNRTVTPARRLGFSSESVDLAAHVRSSRQSSSEAFASSEASSLGSGSDGRALHP
eukprot:763594-Hanusia_phi.AAC.2